MTAHTAWILDTNVVSEMMRARPEPRVARFLDGIAAEGIGLASIAVWEILNGIGRLEAGRRRKNLTERFQWLLDDFFEDRIFDWSVADARACALVMERKRRLGEPLDSHLPDAMLAGTALNRGLTIVTRNEREFRNTGARAVNPWNVRGQPRAGREGAALFDGYLAVDWSAHGKPKRGDDSIWIAARGWGGTEELQNPVSRAEAVARIEALLRPAADAGRRLLCGFDFPFGYPAGTARSLTGRDGWEAVWSRVAEVVRDGPDNANNRFDAAAVLNAAFPGDGPFWGNGLKRDIPGLPRKKPSGWGRTLPPGKRHAEILVPRAQEVWKLSGAGSVGGQALTGIAALEGLRRRAGAQVWPFETLGEGRSPVLAEIYPSLIDPCPGNEVLDARQVKAVAMALRELDRTGNLRHYLRAPLNMPDRVRREEGAILGMHDQKGFKRARQRVEPCC